MDLDGPLEGLTTPLLIFLFAFSPGICEELVFRGAFLGLLRRVGTTRAAVLLSSIYFGLIHLSVFRFVPTFLLGLLMAGLTVSTGSIFPAMVFHMAYNGLAVWLGRLSLELPQSLTGASGWGVSLALLALGFAMVRSARTISAARASRDQLLDAPPA
jgi:membrane protease YdiL (CAAX protease family)